MNLTDIRRIAVFRAIFLGDLLLAVPAWRALRRTFPQAEITLIGLPWAASFVQRFSCYIDRFVEFAGYPGLAEVPVNPERVAAFLTEQRAYGYDLAIQMHGSGGTSNPFVLALGGRITAGYHLGPPPTGLTVAAPYPDDQPEIYRNLNLVRLLGCQPLDAALEFPLAREDRAEADRLLAPLPPGGPVIAFHPGAKAPARRWPPEHFATLGDALARRYNARIILTGSGPEQVTVQAVQQQMQAPALNLAGRTSLGGLAAVIGAVDLFISNDTGPAHLADALDTPSVTIFGPADLQRWAPLNRRRHPCLEPATACSSACDFECALDQRCLRLLRPATVLAVAATFLTETPPSLSAASARIIAGPAVPPPKTADLTSANTADCTADRR